MRTSSLLLGATFLFLGGCSSAPDSGDDPSLDSGATRDDAGNPYDSGLLGDAIAPVLDGSAPAIPTVGCPTGLVSDPSIKQALPQATVDTTYPPPGKVIQVPAGANLQAAINAAQLGDTLELAAGATYPGPITLPNKQGSGWVVIRTSTPDQAFAMPGTRVNPTLAPKMAKMVAGTGPEVIGAANGAHHYRLVGLEITPNAGATVNTLVELSAPNKSFSEIPHHIVFDRVYLHGEPTLGTRRGVGMNSASTAMIDSYVSGIRVKGFDSQAIAGWGGPGPFVITGNYLEAATENIMFGGSDPSVTNLVPSDITICGNHLHKDPAWQPVNGWAVKNLFELKNARRLLLAGNVLDTNWADAQAGYAIMLTPRNQGGNAPWSTIEDVTIAYNVIVHSGSGVELAASDSNHKSQESARVVIHDNLFDDINPAKWGGDGRAWMFLRAGGGGVDIKFDHNTTTSNKQHALMLGDTPKYGTNFVFTNNIVPRGTYGVFGTGKSEGKVSLDYYLVSYTFEKNVVFGNANPALYPANNFFPAMSAVGFTNSSGGDWSLAPSSPYAKAGTDGRDVGADMVRVIGATKGVIAP